MGERLTAKKKTAKTALPAANSLPPTPSFFAVSTATLHGLSGHRAVEVFRDLLWAEARRQGLPAASVTINEQVEIP